MIKWDLLDDTDVTADKWNGLLVDARDYTVFQSYGWGEYKRKAGWQPLRFVARNKDGQVVGMVQLLLKLLPMGLGMAWAAGGPVLQFGRAGSEPLGKDLAGLLQIMHEKYPRVLVRFHSHLPHDSGLAYGFNQACRRPFYKLNSGFTIHMDLNEVGDDLLSRMTSKHRYYARKAAKAPLQWRAGSSDEDIAALVLVHREMVTNKNMHSIATSEEELIKLRDALDPDGMTILTGYIDEEPVTSCLTFDFGKRAIYMVAATGNEGRKVSAAYAMIVQLIPVLQKKGIEHFDFGGLDPVTPAAEGVNHFKRGFGGQITEYLGEWEGASSEMLRVGMNLAILKKGGRV